MTNPQSSQVVVTLSKLYVFVDNDALGTLPVIIPVTDIVDPMPGLGAPWGQVKARMREYYLNKAAALRAVTEKDYFKHA